MKSKFTSAILLAVAVFAAAGCGKQADTSKPVEQIKKEVEGMSLSQLESKAKAYASEITSKKSDIQQVQEKLKSLSPQELLGEKAKGIKDEISKITTEVKALSERYDVYADQFRKAGGDISKIKIG